MKNDYNLCRDGKKSTQFLELVKNKRISTITLIYKNMFNQNQSWQPKGLALLKTNQVSLFCDYLPKSVASVFWLIVLSFGMGVSGKAQSIDTLVILGPVCTGNSTPIYFSTTGIQQSWSMYYNYYKLEVVDSAASLAGAENSGVK